MRDLRHYQRAQKEQRGYSHGRALELEYNRNLKAKAPQQENIVDLIQEVGMAAVRPLDASQLETQRVANYPEMKGDCLSKVF